MEYLTALGLLAALFTIVMIAIFAWGFGYEGACPSKMSDYDLFMESRFETERGNYPNKFSREMERRQQSDGVRP